MMLRNSKKYKPENLAWSIDLNFFIVFQLFDMLKELGTHNKVKCRNYRCKNTPTTTVECVTHFRKCGVAVKNKSRITCDKCGLIFKSRKASVNHVCPEAEVSLQTRHTRNFLPTVLCFTYSVLPILHHCDPVDCF